MDHQVLMASLAIQVNKDSQDLQVHQASMDNPEYLEIGEQLVLGDHPVSVDNLVKEDHPDSMEILDYKDLQDQKV